MSILSTDLIDVPIDPVTGDLVIDSAGRVTLTKGPSAINQGIRIRLQLIRGECFVDLDEGIPYFERQGVLATQAIFGQKFDRKKVLSAFRDAILSTPGVVSLLDLTVTFDGKTRSLQVTWQVKTEFGDTPPDTLALGE